MEDSTTYQEIFEKGVQMGLEKRMAQENRQLYQKVLLRQGTKRFGDPTPEIAAALEQITDLNRLDHLAERMLDATGWEDLLRSE
ncbi:DUF4351 domain-containing protein [Frigoriglobus tundricola]|nr:DUF4351 domain-containing protein [Frigoriglobus tundricola]